MAIKRGTGRQALIDVTADLLRSGGDVQIADVAARVGVSHTLIYRHFPEGGKDELLGEAYAEVFRGLASQDMTELIAVIQRKGISRDAIRGFARKLLAPTRDEPRWARLEALAQVRTNAFAARRIEETRQQLLAESSMSLRELNPGWSQDYAEALAVSLMAIPLGITAIGGTQLSRARRDVLADQWTDAVIALLTADEDGR
ncbi:MAG: Bacterial regulatory protein tetR family [Actinomycetota bacterium]|jgi:AcrR family transcriptional regulator